MKFLLVIAALTLSLTAHAGSNPKFSYTCGTYWTVQIYSELSIFATDNAEWSEDYKLVPGQDFRTAASIRYEFAHPKSADEALSANQVVISRSMLEGAPTAYVIFVRGESQGKYACTLDK